MIRFRLVTAQSSSVNGDGFWGVQPDAHGKSPGVGHFTMMHSFGFVARPVDPENNNGRGCLMLEGTEGCSEQFSWLCHDPRFYSKIPPLSQGSSCQYNSAGAFFVLDTDKETAIWYQPYTDGTTKAHKITMGKDGAGVPVFEFKGGDGQYLQFQNSKATLRGSGNASIKLDGDNCDLNGTTNIAGSLTVALGTEPVALAPEVLVCFTAIETCLAAMGAAVAAFDGGASTTAVTALVATLSGITAKLASLTLKAL